MKIVLKLDRHAYEVFVTVELHDQRGVQVLADHTPITDELSMHVGDATCIMEGITMGAAQANMQ